MTISTCASLPRIVPASSSSWGRNKAHQQYPNVALIRSERVSPPISLTQTKAIPTAFDMMRTISEKDDAEIQSELNQIQNSCEMLKGFLGDFILVLLATNPILQRISDAIHAKNRFLRWSSIGAAYGVFIVLKECAKVLWKSKPIWAFIIVGFLIYKANMCNIALYKKGRRPVWLGPPLSVLVVGKFFADLFLPFTGFIKCTPLNIILASIDIVAGYIMSAYFHDDNLWVLR